MEVLTYHFARVVPRKHRSQRPSTPLVSAMEEDPESRPAAECLVSLSPDVVAYTAEELELIRISKTNNEDGSKRRTTVYDIDGNAYTLPGQQRHDGDFTMPSGFRIYRQHWTRATKEYWIRDFTGVGNWQYWIRATKQGEAPEFRGGWFVIDRRRLRLVHPNSRFLMESGSMMHATL